MVAVPRSMFQVLLNTLLDGVFQKYLPIFFMGRKTELCSAVSLLISAKFLTVLFILPPAGDAALHPKRNRLQMTYLFCHI